MTREEAYAAIFDVLAQFGPAPGGDGTFKTVSRRLQLVETFDPSMMPAIFQQQLTEPVASGQYGFGGFEFSVLNLCWYIYVYQPDGEAPMSPDLNAAVDQVMNTIFTKAPTITVGELDFSLLPMGVMYWEGLLGDRAVARINLQAKPVSIP